MNKHAMPLATALALVASLGTIRLQARPDDAPPAATPSAGEEAIYVPVGFYTGTRIGSAASGAGIPFQAEVVQVRGRNHARLICSQPGDNCYEDWVWDDRSLSVTRHTFIPGNRMPDRRMREEVAQLRGYLSGGRYRLVSLDQEGTDCGMGLPAGSYLTIATTADGFRCEVWQRLTTPQPGQMVLSQAFDFERTR